MKKELTPKQKLVYQTLKEYFQNHGQAPTLRELQEALAENGLDLASLNSLVQYLNTLEEKHYLERFSHPRGIRLLEREEINFVEIPLVGRADCGEAIHFADDFVESYINISKKFIRGSKSNYYFVKAVGDSMNQEGIENGDYVLVRKIDQPEKNDLVLAVINGLGTIKKYFPQKENILLLPCSDNPIHKPIILHPEDEIFISGKVIKVFKFNLLKNQEK